MTNAIEEAAARHSREVEVLEKTVQQAHRDADAAREETRRLHGAMRDLPWWRRIFLPEALRYRKLSEGAARSLGSRT